jgi:hypothetical protein
MIVADRPIGVHRPMIVADRPVAVVGRPMVVSGPAAAEAVPAVPVVVAVARPPVAGASRLVGAGRPVGVVVVAPRVRGTGGGPAVRGVSSGVEGRAGDGTMQNKQWGRAGTTPPFRKGSPGPSSTGR